MRTSQGFTIAELLITLGLMSIIVLVSFVVLSPQKRTNEKELVYRYAAAYNALNKTTRSIKQDVINQEPPADGTPNLNNPFVDSIDAEQKKIVFENLCNNMAEYLNNEEANCSYEWHLDDSYAFGLDSDYDYRNITPNIKTLNGMSIYISKRYEYSQGPTAFFFYMIYVDLYTKEKRGHHSHSIRYDSTMKKLPNVFAFALVPSLSWNVIPIGAAEYNRVICPIKIAYRGNSTGTRTNIYNSNETFSLHEAQHAAWGWYAGNAPTFKPEVGFTYTNFIFNYILNNYPNSHLYDGLDLNVIYNTPLYNNGRCAGSNEERYTHCILNLSLPRYMK